MPTLGQTLKQARERKKLSASQAAAAIRLKVQHVEAMERDDFSRAAAPIYAKGFIRLYAVFLDLDPAPLVQEYVDLHAPGDRPPAAAVQNLSSPRRAPRANPLKAIDWAAISGMFRRRRNALLIAAAVLVAVAAVVTAIRHSAGRPRDVAQVEPPKPVARQRGALPVIMEPPDAYAQQGGTSEATP